MDNGLTVIQEPYAVLIYYGTQLPPRRVPIPILRPDDRIGDRYYRCDPDKIVAIVHTPHLLAEAFSWHLNYLQTGRMISR